MRRQLVFTPVLGLLVIVGCGPNTPTEHTGPAITPLTGRTVPAGYGRPGEGPPAGGTKPPTNPPGMR